MQPAQRENGPVIQPAGVNRPSTPYRLRSSSILEQRARSCQKAGSLNSLSVSRYRSISKTNQEQEEDGSPPKVPHKETLENGGAKRAEVIKSRHKGAVV
ncbi:hypothetical protein VTN49DRAFT_3137 [Thermomyces lanuginosus]|uniref:uncharacterized protein n=1 Tax=Thermomyces lanuginosus TaxID=5541 RepID=UPI003742FB42